MSRSNRDWRDSVRLFHAIQAAAYRIAGPESRTGFDDLYYLAFAALNDSVIRQEEREHYAAWINS